MAAKKRREAAEALDVGILSELNSAFTSAESGGPQRRRSSIKGSRKGSAAATPRRVRWPDKESKGSDEEGPQGFMIQPSLPPLAVVHYVEGLGPAPGENALVYMDEASPFITNDARTFADQVKAEHDLEQKRRVHFVSDAAEGVIARGGK